MATIHFSQRVNQSLFNGNNTGQIVRSNNTPDIYTIAGVGTVAESVLEIYKGTVPTFPTLTNASTVAANLLISFPLANPSSISTLAGSAIYQLLGKRLIDTAATAGGVATWFLLRRTNTTALNTSGGMIGTVGLLGSGEDLEVPSTIIVQGQNYQSAGFTLSWTLTRTVS